MKKIVILGAGKSSRHLIKHLYNNLVELNISIHIADLKIDEIQTKLPSKNGVTYYKLTENSEDEIEKLINGAFLTISMLPPSLHTKIAQFCIENSSHLIIPSYLTSAIKNLSDLAKEKKISIVAEMGFDPGLDHLTTLEIVNEMAEKGLQLISYKSYAGGLVAAESDNNPWNYKFTWNPINVVRAGQGGMAKFLENGSAKYIPSHAIFNQYEMVVLPNGFSFDGYANRDSIQYQNLYGWEYIQTLKRGTLRRLNFCKAWDILVNLGLTDTSTEINLPPNTSLFDFYSRFYSFKSFETAKNDFIKMLGNKFDKDIEKKLEYIGFWDNTTEVPAKEGVPAFILQKILEEKWKLESDDKDTVVLGHFFEFLDPKTSTVKHIDCYYSEDGEDSFYTAMSKAVGMPIAFMVELFLDGSLNQYGCILPFSKEIYSPLLKKLRDFGFEFHYKVY